MSDLSQEMRGSRVILVQFLVGWAIRTGILVSVAALACVVSPWASATTKNHIWRTALVSSLIIGIAVLVIPPVKVGVPSVASANSTYSLQTHSQNAIAVLPDSPPKVHSKFSDLTSTLPLRPTSNFSSQASYFVLTYLLGVLAVLGRWVSSLVQVRRICQSGKSVGENILVVSKLSVPATLGLRRPRILLPAAALEWPADRLNMAMEHEWAHIVRRDWAWLLLGAFLTAVQWFNPAVWILAKKLRATAEEAADDSVLASGVTASRYAAELLAIVSEPNGMNLSAVSFGRSGEMKMRVKHVLADGRPRRQTSKGMILTVSVGFATIALGLASVQANPTPLQASGKLPPPDNSGYRGMSYHFSDGAQVSLDRWRSEPVKQAQISWPSGKVGKPEAVLGDDPDKRQVTIDYTIMLPSTSDAVHHPFDDCFNVKLNGIWAGTTSGRGGNLPERRRVTCEAKYMVPKKWQQADLQIGRGLGAYKLVAESRGRKGSLHYAVIHEQQTEGTSVENGISKKMIYRSTDLTFKEPVGFREKDWRIRAFDANGKPLQIFDDSHLRNRQPSDPKELRTTIEAAAGAIDHIMLEVRDYEWANFKIDLQSHLPERKKLHP